MRRFLVLITILLSTQLALGQAVSSGVIQSQQGSNEGYGYMTDPVLVLTTAQTTSNSLYWFQIIKTDLFPMITTSSPYACIWSTDHSGGAGGIYWGEMDDLDFLNFSEAGLIEDGDQAETPYLIISPNDPDGETLHLYWHPDTTHPDSGGYQQTRLWTTTGGALHTATWTDRGKPLGIINPPTTEQHTGYLYPYRLKDNTFIGHHSAKGAFGATPETIPKIGISTSTDGRSWTRVTSEMDVLSFMPTDRQFHMQPAIFFERNGKQYAIGVEATYDFDFSQTKIVLAAADNYEPYEYLQEISTATSGRGNTNATFYIEGNTLHIYYTVSETSLYHSTYDLTNLGFEYRTPPPAPAGMPELYVAGDAADPVADDASVNNTYWVVGAGSPTINHAASTYTNDSNMITMENPSADFSMFRLTMSGLDPAKEYDLTMITRSDNEDDTAPADGNNFNDNDGTMTVTQGDDDLFFSTQTWSSNTIRFSPDSTDPVTPRIYPRFGSDHTSNTGAGNVPELFIAYVSLKEVEQ